MIWSSFFYRYPFRCAALIRRRYILYTSLLSTNDQWGRYGDHETLPRMHLLSSGPPGSQDLCDWMMRESGLHQRHDLPLEGSRLPWRHRTPLTRSTQHDWWPDVGIIKKNVNKITCTKSVFSMKIFFYKYIINRFSCIWITFFFKVNLTWLLLQLPL